MAQAVVALGGNLGDVPQTFARALSQLADHSSIANLLGSSLYSSAPMGAIAGDTFFNAACVCETTLEPEPLLTLLQQIEADCGRVRHERWGPRTLDLDLIFYNSQQLATPRLAVPHPHAWYRRFVIEPVAELLPDFPHPVLAVTLQQLHEFLNAPTMTIHLGGVALPELLAPIAQAFPGVQLLPAETPAPGRPSLGIWLEDSNAPAPVLPAYWLKARADSARQFLSDVLTAARGNLIRIGTPVTPVRSQ